jgi:hypothetical protein
LRRRNVVDRRATNLREGQGGISMERVLILYDNESHREAFADVELRLPSDE